MFFCDINIPASHGYICRKHHFQEGYVSRTHWHGFVELEFFIEGTGTHIYNGATYEIKPGDVWILSTNDSHQLNLDKGMKSINIALDPDILHEKMREHLAMFHPLHCTFDEKESRAFLEKVEVLWHEQRTRELLSRVKAVSIINEFLVDIARKSSADQEPTMNNSLVSDMANYLQANYHSNISLAEMARVFSFTPNYCGRLFREMTGITFNDYLNNLRVKHACKLLLTSNLPIREIAFESGFNSLEYFYTTFKKFYGVTPAKYRKLTPTEIQKKSPVSKAFSLSYLKE